MYKVFFNDSTLKIGSDFNKLLKNQEVKWVDSNDLSAVDQLIPEMENSLKQLHFAVDCSEPELFWKIFKSRFTEIQAAGGLVRNKAGSCLFINRLGYWDLPKGKIEKNETAELAAIREVEEECGITGLSIRKKLDSTYHIYRSAYLTSPENLVLKKTHWFLMEYAGSEVPVPQVEEDIEEVKWVSLHDLDTILPATYSSLRDLILKSFPLL